MRADAPEPRGLSASNSRATRRATSGCPTAAPPQVSVVIPSQNRRDFLLRSIGTALAQTDVDVEVIVVDDGSDLPVSTYVPSDPRVRVLRHRTPKGVSAARNLGIETASYRWVAFLDDDDLWAPHKLSTQVAAMEDANRLWSHTGKVRLAVDLSVISVEPASTRFANYPEILECNAVATPTAVVIDRDLVREAGEFDPAFSTMADWDLWVRVAEIAPAAVVADALVGYVIHDESMHRQGTRALVRELQAMKRKHRGQYPVGGLHVWEWIAQTHRRNGHPITSGVLFCLAVLAHPRGLWRKRSAAFRSLLRRVARRDPFGDIATPDWLAQTPSAELAELRSRSGRLPLPSRP